MDRSAVRIDVDASPAEALQEDSQVVLVHVHVAVEIRPLAVRMPLLNAGSGQARLEA